MGSLMFQLEKGGNLKRFCARLTDLLVYGFLWRGIVYGLFDSMLLLSPTGKFVASFFSFVLMIFIEPILLSLFRTTLGKGIFGIYVQKVNGGKLSYSEGFKRVIGVFFWGQGLNIVIFSQIRYILSFLRAQKGQELPWETEGKVFIKNQRKWAYFVVVMLIAGLIGGNIFMERSAVMPKYRGTLTKSEFAENYNRYLKYYLGNPEQLLREDGALAETVTDLNNGGIKSRVRLSNIQFMEEAGKLEGVCLEADVVGEELVTGYQEIAASAFLAFVAANREISYRDVIKRDMFSLCGYNVYKESFSFDLAGVHVSASISKSNYDDSYENMLAKGSSAKEAKYHLVFKMTY